MPTIIVPRLASDPPRPAWTAAQRHAWAVKILLAIYAPVWP